MRNTNKSENRALPAAASEPRPRPATPPSSQARSLDLVLEGGGVKGISLVGAIAALNDRIEAAEKCAPSPDAPACRRLLRHRYTLEGGRAAGTSAGAIIAALVAAGYKATELRNIVFGPDISRFADTSWLSKIPIIGAPIDMTVGLLTELGLYKGDYFLQYLRALLLDKGVSTFADLITDRKETNPVYRYKAHFIASDITRGRMLVLPDDINVERYGVSADNLEVALAVRMSISFPFFFRPVMTTGRDGVKSYLVDGGLLSNFPIDIFDDPREQSGARSSLTVGIRIGQNRYHDIGFPFKALRAAYALASTAIQAHDLSASAKYIDRLKWARAIQINTSAISILNFKLSELQKEVLYDEGYTAMSRGIDAFLGGAEDAQAATIKALGSVQGERIWVEPPTA